jgi:hypothetical protein
LIIPLQHSSSLSPLLFLPVQDAIIIHFLDYDNNFFNSLSDSSLKHISHPHSSKRILFQQKADHVMNLAQSHFMSLHMGKFYFSKIATKLSHPTFCF